MPINLRYDLRFRFDRTLALRMEAAWRQIDRLSEAAVRPQWWEAFHTGRMRRSFIRHRATYRLKARLHVALTYANAVLEGAGGDLGAMVIFLPFYVVYRLLAPRPREAMDAYEAFLLKCEIEDLQDEIQRRLDRRKRRQTA
jgi:hypothetical protein